MAHEPGGVAPGRAVSPALYLDAVVVQLARRLVPHGEHAAVFRLEHRLGNPPLGRGCLRRGPHLFGGHGMYLLGIGRAHRVELRRAQRLDHAEVRPRLVGVAEHGCGERRQRAFRRFFERSLVQATRHNGLPLRARVSPRRPTRPEPARAAPAPPTRRTRPAPRTAPSSFSEPSGCPRWRLRTRAASGNRRARIAHACHRPYRTFRRAPLRRCP